MKKITLETREQLESFLKENIITTTEAMKILEISRARLTNMVKEGKLSPIKKVPGLTLYYRPDVEKRRDEQEELRKKYRPYDY